MGMSAGSGGGEDLRKKKKGEKEGKKESLSEVLGLDSVSEKATAPLQQLTVSSFLLALVLLVHGAAALGFRYLSPAGKVPSWLANSKAEAFLLQLISPILFEACGALLGLPGGAGVREARAIGALVLVVVGVPLVFLSVCMTPWLQVAAYPEERHLYYEVPLGYEEALKIAHGELEDGCLYRHSPAFLQRWRKHRMELYIAANGWSCEKCCAVEDDGEGTGLRSAAGKAWMRWRSFVAAKLGSKERKRSAGVGDDSATPEPESAGEKILQETHLGAPVQAWSADGKPRPEVMGSGTKGRDGKGAEKGRTTKKCGNPRCPREVGGGEWKVALRFDGPADQIPAVDALASVVSEFSANFSGTAGPLVMRAEPTYDFFEYDGEAQGAPPSSEKERWCGRYNRGVLVPVGHQRGGATALRQYGPTLAIMAKTLIALVVMTTMGALGAASGEAGEMSVIKGLVAVSLLQAIAVAILALFQPYIATLDVVSELLTALSEFGAYMMILLVSRPPPDVVDGDGNLDIEAMSTELLETGKRWSGPLAAFVMFAMGTQVAVQLLGLLGEFQGKVQELAVAFNAAKHVWVGAVTVLLGLAKRLLRWHYGYKQGGMRRMLTHASFLDTLRAMKEDGASVEKCKDYSYYCNHHRSHPCPLHPSRTCSHRRPSTECHQCLPSTECHQSQKYCDGTDCFFTLPATSSSLGYLAAKKFAKMWLRKVRGQVKADECDAAIEGDTQLHASAEGDSSAQRLTDERTIILLARERTLSKKYANRWLGRIAERRQLEMEARRRMPGREQALEGPRALWPWLVRGLGGLWGAVAGKSVDRDHATSDTPGLLTPELAAERRLDLEVIDVWRTTVGLDLKARKEETDILYSIVEGLAKSGIPPPNEQGHHQKPSHTGRGSGFRVARWKTEAAESELDRLLEQYIKRATKRIEDHLRSRAVTGCGGEGLVLEGCVTEAADKRIAAIVEEELREDASEVLGSGRDRPERKGGDEAAGGPGEEDPNAEASQQAINGEELVKRVAKLGERYAEWSKKVAKRVETKLEAFKARYGSLRPARRIELPTHLGSDLAGPIGQPRLAWRVPSTSGSPTGLASCGSGPRTRWPELVLTEVTRANLLAAKLQMAVAVHGLHAEGTIFEKVRRREFGGSFASMSRARTLARDRRTRILKSGDSLHYARIHGVRQRVAVIRALKNDMECPPEAEESAEARAAQVIKKRWSARSMAGGGRDVEEAAGGEGSLEGEPAGWRARAPRWRTALLGFLGTRRSHTRANQVAPDPPVAPSSIAARPAEPPSAPVPGPLEMEDLEREMSSGRS